jgi:cell migration-inducing and hyaluronan-binding protein
MRRRHHLLLSLLVPAFILFTGWVYVAGQEKKPSAGEKGPSASNGMRWSDPATWPERKVPGKGDAVTIGRDMDVVLDVSPPALRSVTVDGKLRFSNSADLELTSEWILLHGELQIGTEATPYTRKATITLTNDVPGEDIMTMGDRGIMLMGGTLNLHGNRKDSWT